MLVQDTPAIFVLGRILWKKAHQPEEGLEKTAARPFDFAFPSSITTTTLAKTLMATIFWVVQMSSWINDGCIITGGVVNTMYNETTFSNMIHLVDLATEHLTVSERKTYNVSARREKMGRMPRCCLRIADWTCVYLMTSPIGKTSRAVPTSSY
jgi:hypothetical protein